MTSASLRPVIVLLAAGASSRFGVPKQLQCVHGIPLVRRAALVALETGLSVWLVTGAEAVAVDQAVAGLPLHLVHNDAWSNGMGGSLARGVLEAAPQASAVLVMLADQPLIETDDLRRLLSQSAAHPDAIVAADHGEVLGPPCVFPGEFFDELASLQGDRGARALFKQHAERVRRVTMPHAALDVDTPEDLSRAEAALSASAVLPAIRRTP